MAKKKPAGEREGADFKWQGASQKQKGSRKDKASHVLFAKQKASDIGSQADAESFVRPLFASSKKGPLFPQDVHFASKRKMHQTSSVSELDAEKVGSVMSEQQRSELHYNKKAVEEEPSFPSDDGPISAQGEGALKKAHGDEDGIKDAGEGHVDTSHMTQADMTLEKLVALPTWREMLLDLVANRKLDPWNIDIVEITTGYIERIRNMEMLDLRVPANLILAAAILIRFKSDALRFEEEAQFAVEETYVDEDAEPETIPVLELKTRVPPKRMVSLDELLMAMEKVFDDQRKREEKAQKISIPSVINIQLPEFSIEERMGEIYERVLEEKDSEGLATFSSILKEKNPLEIIMTLIPILHLVQDGNLSIFQEKFFGEIFIRVRENNHSEADEKGEEDGKN